jgi:hypothetical protein
MRIDDESQDLGPIVAFPSCKCKLFRNAGDKLVVTKLPGAKKKSQCIQTRGILAGVEQSEVEGVV